MQQLVGLSHVEGFETFITISVLLIIAFLTLRRFDYGRKYCRELCKKEPPPAAAASAVAPDPEVSLQGVLGQESPSPLRRRLASNRLLNSLVW